VSDKPAKVIVVEQQGKGCVGTGLALAGILASFLWLLNLGAGIVELPDNLPFVGNIDEVFAAGVFFSCLRYLGFDLIPFGKKAAPQIQQIIEQLPDRSKNK
jgi:hypothetical protein